MKQPKKQKVAIRFPVLGQHEGQPVSNQPLLTTSDSLNMRGIDPVTLRQRGGQRSGLTKFSTAQIGVGVAAGTSVSLTYDAKKIEFTNLLSSGTGSTAADEIAVAWSANLPNTSDCKNLAIDPVSGDVWVLDGKSTLLRFNSSGRKLTTYPLPVLDDDHVCRALHVDQLGHVYVGTSSGGKQENTRLFCLKGDDDNGLNPHWDDALTPSAYVVSLDTFNGRLYVLQNRPDRGRSDLVAYTSIETSVPELVWSVPVPYPSNCLSCTPTGDIVVTSEANATRGTDPKYPTFTKVTKGGYVIRRDLASYSKRVWAHWRADTVNGLDGNGDPLPLPTDGTTINVWFDISGNERHWFAPLITDADKATAPTFRAEVGPGGPGIHFGKYDSIGAAQKQCLTTRFNATTSANYSDQQRTAFPAYTGAQCAVFISCRPAVKSELGVIIGQDAAGSTTGYDHLIVANRRDSATATAGYVKTNERQAAAGTVAAAGDGFAPAASFNNANSWAVIGEIFDGGLGLADATPWTTQTKSLYEVNGTRTDRWASEAGSLVTLQASELGRFIDQLGQGYFEGDIVEILVLNVQSTSEPKILTHQFYPEGATYVQHTDSNADEFEKIIGAMNHESGVSHLLNNSTFPHPYYVTRGAPTVNFEPINTLSSPYAILAKFSPNEGGLVWALSAIGGIGYGCKCAPDGSIYTMGPQQAAVIPDSIAADNYIYRRVIDTPVNEVQTLTFNATGGVYTLGFSGETTGSLTYANTTGDTATILAALEAFVSIVPGDVTVSRGTPSGNVTIFTVTFLGRFAGRDVPVMTVTETLTGGAGTLAVATATAGSGATYAGTGGSWRVDPTAGMVPEDHFPTIAADKNSNGYFPLTSATVANNFDHTAIVYDTTGSIIAEFETPRDVGATTTARQTYAIAVPATTPEYQTTLTGQRAEFAYMGLKASSGADQLKRVNFVEADNITGSPRALIVVTRAGADIKKVTATTATTPTGGTGVIDSASEFVSACTVFGKAYFGDGKKVWVYDPKLDTVTELVSETSGEAPTRCRLWEPWQGGLVGARDPNNPSWAHFSGGGRPTDWNFNPLVPTDNSAFTLSDPRVGPCPDIINSMAGLANDLFILFCDHSIQRLEGRPSFQGSASFQLVSDITGGAFGQSWCKDQDGFVYFFGSKGGLFRMDPRAHSVESLTLGRFERTLNAIPLNSFYPALAWDSDADGVHVKLIPFDPSTVANTVTHFFFERQGKFAPWPDQYGTHLVTGIFEVDGDGPDDRSVCMCFNDGYIRKFDKTANDDDGETIQSRILLGPYEASGPEFELKISKFQATLGEQHGVAVTLFGSDAPDEPDSALAVYDLRPGANNVKLPKVSASYVWIEFERASPSERWAYESGFMEYFEGRKRVRVTA